MGDAGDGTRWMTYAELATSRCISRTSATRLASRKGWPRQLGNDGQARIAVPAAAQVPPPDAAPVITPVALPGGAPGDVEAITPGTVPDNGGAEALTRERQRADRAEVQAAEARTLAEQRGVDLMDAVERAAKAEGQVEGLREALAEARRPAWRRWLGWD